MPCLKKELAFNSISSQHFDKIFRDAPIISLSFTENQSFTENVNKFLQEQSKYLLNCQYYNISELNNMIVNHKEKLYLFHLNISSLPYHFQDLNDLLKSLKKTFSFIRITESQLKVNLQPLINIDPNNYNIESTPTKSEKGGTLLYFSSELNCKVQNDLKVYTAKELESVIEIINKDNCIVGCMSKHKKMLTHKFKDLLTPILEKMSLESKEEYVMGDLNINLMTYETDHPTSHFLDNACSNSFFPYVNIPTRHTLRSKTLIDNTLHNGINGNTISGNISTDISDHLAQFLITSYQKHSETKPKKY